MNKNYVKTKIKNLNILKNGFFGFGFGLDFGFFGFFGFGVGVGFPTQIQTQNPTILGFEPLLAPTIIKKKSIFYYFYLFKHIFIEYNYKVKKLIFLSN